jgi:hypothetical protein
MTKAFQAARAPTHAIDRVASKPNRYQLCSRSSFCFCKRSQWMEASRVANSGFVPPVRAKVRRNFYSDASYTQAASVARLALHSWRGGNQHLVQVHRVRRIVVFVAQLQLSGFPGLIFISHAAKSHNDPFANGGALARCVDVAEHGAILRQVLSIPSFRRRHFLVERLRA